MAIVGIDLGTTNSLAAVWSENGPELIPNALGEELTPSAVSIDTDGSVLVGRAALDRLVTEPDRTAASFKRWMGSATGTRLAGKTYRPEELSSFVLRALREDAEARLGESIEEAVVSVPAYFNDPQRKATLDAARLAGLKVERLINEPTAAALAHGLEEVQEGRFLILDLGGGTFDVSLLHKFEGIMEVRASAGDSLLGGNDFRDALVGLLSRRHGLVPDKLVPRDAARLLREADRLKHEMTDQARVEYKFSAGKGEYSGGIGRDEFEELVQPLLKRMRLPIERAIRDARIEPDRIDQVVLVGGATRMPLVRQLATRLFGRFPLVHPRPDHIVALGAAVQSGLKARHAALDDLIMTDVCPFTLGTTIVDDRAPDGLASSPIIERNAIVPISRSGLYYTVRDNQARISIDVMQGENLRPSQNIKIGEIVVPMPLAPAGRECVEVRYTYDVNGALEVEVKVVSTGHSERRVFRNQANLDQAELDERFAALSHIKLAPRDQAENRALIARAERLYAELLGAARDQVRELLNAFEDSLKDQHRNSFDGLRRDFAASLDRFDRSPF